MKIQTIDDNQNRIDTKEELMELLKSYKGILTNPFINYLNSLIELEFSAIRDYISDTDRIALSELEIYKRVAMYNIYNRALNIFQKQEPELKIHGNNEEINYLSVYASIGEKNTKLFEFNYQEGPIGIQSQIPGGYKTMRIGKISLFQTIESIEQRELELMRVIGVLDRLYDKQSPYQSSTYSFGGPDSLWLFEHNKKIKEYEEKFAQLDSKKELTEEEKQEVEITKKFHEQLLEDYGLTNKSFEDENNQYFTKSTKEQTELQKTLVKKIPNIDIINHIKYI